jgi:uncharacterized membrane protein YeaQ/YmgE (transglycosylase-associated protein family)
MSSADAEIGTVMGFISWIVVGLIAGAVAKMIMPGDDPGGFFITILIGIAGAFVGGFVGELLGIGGAATGVNLPTLITATGGALVLLFAYRLIKKKA